MTLKLLCAAAALVLASCGFSFPVLEQPYRGTAGTTQTLKRDCVLDFSSGKGRSPGYPKFSYFLDDEEPDGTDTVLKRGTKLHIDTVRWYLLDARGEWRGVVGRVNHPHTGEEVKFLYIWGMAENAPWLQSKRPWL